MAQVHIDFSKTTGKIKPMHAVNNGVVQGRQNNFESYKAAGFPYARNHDASYNEEYGVEHTVDITAIFPDFSADPTDPTSYDFFVTDAYLARTIEAGTKIFYRLGQRIEHTVKRYHVYPPADFQKWAVICEHIIRHYTEGWADGFHWDIPYWEIWNEPDITPQCWIGTREQFCDFFTTAFAHLKSCFPHLKIGGPALAGNLDFLTAVLGAMQEKHLTPDFVSWHIYCTDPHAVGALSRQVQKRMEDAGFAGAESICNEWNYVEGWENEGFTRSVEAMIGMKGAAFNGAVLCVGQNSPVDMLMYYDARPVVFNGLFDFYTLRPLKGYYAFSGWNHLYRLGTAVQTETDDPDPELYAAAATDAEGHKAAFVVYYTTDPAAVAKEVRLDMTGTFTAYRTSETETDTEIGTLTCPCTITLEPNSILRLRGK